MLVPYNESDSKSFYTDFYRSQVGNGLSVYKGRVNTQHGRGIGSFLSGMLKKAAPVLKKAATRVGKELLSTGAQVASDALSGKNVGASLKRRFKESGTNLLREAIGGASAMAAPPPIKKRKKAKKRAKRDLF